MAWAFPEGGWAPFPTSAYVPIPLFALACLIVLPREQSALRWGAVLYGLGATLALAIETPMGGNAVRLGALFGGPLILCAIWGRPWTKRPWALPLLAAGFAALALWQWSPAVRDVIKYIEDPAAKSDYFTPLKEFLFRLPDQRRIEIPFTRSHWEGSEVAMDQALARGWLRQLDTKLNPIFYREGLNRLTYASWLADNAVRYVALPSAKPDKSSYGERALIEKGLPYLRLRWKSDDWRVYEVLLGGAACDLAEERADTARAVPVGRAFARCEAAGRGDREGALDAVLVRVERVRRAVWRLDEGDREQGRLRAHVDQVRARAAVLTRTPLRRLCGLGAG